MVLAMRYRKHTEDAVGTYGEDLKMSLTKKGSVEARKCRV